MKASFFFLKEKNQKELRLGYMACALIHIIPIEFLFLGDFFSLYKEKKSQIK